jgi:hypothetical protein
MNASAIQPQDCEKYPPWLPFAAVTRAATATPTAHVRRVLLMPVPLASDHISAN